MNSEQFWGLVEGTRPRGNKPEGHCVALTRRLRRLSPAEIVDFERIFSGLVDEAFRADLWDVTYAISGFGGDDAFVYFRWWLVMQGRDVFETALADPESLIEINGGTEELEHEGYGYVAVKAYRAITGEEDIPYDFHSERGGPGPRPKLRGRSTKSDRGFRRKFPMIWRLLHDRPVIDPAWLRWQDRTVLKLSRSIHEEKRWGDLPILADALEEAGCAEPFLLAHLRANRRHALSCWVTYALARSQSSRKLD
jgi:hypothetical protein